MMRELRPYQREAAARMWAAAYGGTLPGRPLLQLATGGGKTDIIAALAARIERERGGRTVALVPNDVILTQFCKIYEQAGVRDFGVIKAGRAPTPWARHQVASVFTLVRRPKVIADLARGMDAVFIDEAHHVRAASWMRLADAFSAQRIFGFSGSPLRRDGKGMGEVFHELVEVASIPELVDGGYLAPMRTFDLPSGVTGGRVVAGDYSEKDTQRQVNAKVIACAADAYERYVPRKQAVFFGCGIDHSRRVAQELAARGWRAEHVDGDTDDYWIEEVLAKYRRGEIDVLCNAAKLTEGMDVPTAQAVIIGRPTRSVALFLQMAGRAMRPGPGKTAFLLDLCRNTWELGLPDDARDWALDVDEPTGRPRARRAIRERLKPCAECRAMIPIADDSCPICGAEQPRRAQAIREVDAALEEQTHRRAAAPSISKRHIMAQVYAAKGDRAVIEALARKCNYEQGWVAIMTEMSRKAAQEHARKNPELI